MTVPAPFCLWPFPFFSYDDENSTLPTGSWFFSLEFAGFDGFDSFFLSLTPIRKNKVIW